MKPSTVEVQAEAWLQRYAAVRSRTVQLVGPLEPEDCAVQTMPDVSQAKWHLGHTTWVFETFVLQPGLPALLLVGSAHAPVRKILGHLGLPTEAPALAPARSPPQHDFGA